MIIIFNWLNGWRRDMDGWLVRARRSTDPTKISSRLGFVEESAIAVRDHKQARLIDKNLWPRSGGRLG
jgi:hypothetical protein